MFSFTDHQTSTSYHFIPVILPHSHYHHGHSYYGSRASSSSNAASSAASNTTQTATPAPPITAPIVYEMDTSALRQTDRQTAPPALVVAVNNMLVYGELRPNEHLVMVVDERFVDPGEIPAEFLDFIDEDEVTDYQPKLRTTSTSTTTEMPDPRLGIQNTTTTEATVTTSSGVPGNDSQAVFGNQWFSDVDGGL